MPKNAADNPRRILAVGMNQLGDGLFTTPALALLRQHLPDARIDLQAGGRAAATMENNPRINHLYPRPPRKGMARNAALWKLLRENRYDTAVLFQSNLTYAVLTWLARVPNRIGFRQNHCAPFYTTVLPAPAVGEHLAAAYLRLTAPILGEAALAERSPLPFEVAIGDDDRRAADEFFAQHLPLAGNGSASASPSAVAAFVIGTTRPQKSWPEDYWPVLAAKLWKAGKIRAVLVGGPGEMEAAQKIAAATEVPLWSAVGKTNEKQLAALLTRCDVVVSPDSGPLHLAMAVKTPVVGIFGSTDPIETGPWSGDVGVGEKGGIVLYDHLPCAPCNKRPTCGGSFDCLRGITPERVCEAVCAVLGTTSEGVRRLSVLPAKGGAS